ncbi:CoA-binding protein [Thermogymnomonas acidicola]|uniref:CoA-binding protein n=1 Tax=Thermogymnomonas acidicola TaxID=399579 RepID=A0AA37BRG5_9ARCH|nr:CoA-binding protein [Thermogymnomonas acidicola]GGM71805.1 CoA-binding protein [Thermogymnomonas acidicola]
MPLLNGDEEISGVLRKYRNIAVVGISDKPDRDSYRVASYLREHGYSIIPVNPTLKEWNGIRAYPSLSSIPGDLKVEVVDIFRKPEAVTEVVREGLQLKPRVFWMQEGVVNREAADLAVQNGVDVVMDRCMMKEHRRLLGGK